jgi:hypothetical protein
LDGFKYGRTPGGGFKLLAGFQDWDVASTAHEGQETMQPTARSLSMFVLLVSLIGTAALFLPFTTGSFLFQKMGPPWDIVRSFNSEGIFLVGSLFLVIPIIVWEVRRYVAVRLTTGEIAAAYGISTAAMLPALLAAAGVVLDADGYGTALKVLIVSSVALAGANLLLLMRNRRSKLPREATTEAYLLGGYLPGAIISFVFFGWLGGGFSKLHVGAYLIAIVCVGYVVAIVMLSRGKPASSPNPLGASGS